MTEVQVPRPDIRGYPVRSEDPFLFCGNRSMEVEETTVNGNGVLLRLSLFVERTVKSSSYRRSYVGSLKR